MKKLKEAYIGYIDADGSARGIKLAIMKPGMNAANAYKLDYIHYIANALKFIMGRVMYFSDRKNRPVSEVIITDDMLSEYIGCHPNHSPRVLKALKTIFGLTYTRQHFKGGARTITINRTLIDFLGIFSDAELFSFIEKHKIDPRLYRSLQQMYRYRVFSVKPSSNQLRQSQEKARRDFINKNKNFYHHVSSSSKNDHVRIDYIKPHQDKLSTLQRSQLDCISEERKTGKLRTYFFRLLIRLEQFISSLVRTKKDEEQNEVPEQSQFDENTEGMSEAHAAAVAEAVLDMEDYNHIIDTWNNMIGEQSIPQAPKLTKEYIQFINTNVKSNTIERVIQAINNVPNLPHDEKYKYKITFKRFIKDPEHTYWISSYKDESREFEPDWLQEFKRNF